MRKVETGAEWHACRSHGQIGVAWLKPPTSAISSLPLRAAKWSGVAPDLVDGLTFASASRRLRVLWCDTEQSRGGGEGRRKQQAAAMASAVPREGGGPHLSMQPEAAAACKGVRPCTSAVLTSGATRVARVCETEVRSAWGCQARPLLAGEAVPFSPTMDVSSVTALWWPGRKGGGVLM